MKPLRISSLLAVLSVAYASTWSHGAALPAGVLDVAFASSGAQVLRLGSSSGRNGEFRSIAPIPNAGWVAGGWVVNASGLQQNMIARYTPTGALYSGFGTGGVATIPLATGTTESSIYGVAVDGQGRVWYAAEAKRSEGDTALVIGRLTAAGQPDTSYGVNGQRVGNINSANDGGRAIAVDGQGRAVVAGYYTRSDGKWTQFVLRINADGAPDSTFGNEITLPGGNVVPSQVLVRPDGAVLTAGWVSAAGEDSNFRQYLRLHNGSTAAPIAERVSDISASGNDQFEGVSIDAAGRVLTAGYGSVGGQSYALAQRFNANLTPDASFGNGMIPGIAGTAIVGSTKTGGFGKGIHELPDGTIVLGGHVRGGTATETWFSSRLSASGQPGAGGYPSNAEEVTPAGLRGRVRATALTHDGSMVMVGYTVDPALGYGLPTIAKVAVNGLNSFNAEVVEYYSADLVKFFMTGRLSEKQLLDQPNPPNFVRTGVTFNALTSAVGGAKPVRRFFAFVPQRASTHFYLTKPDEIDALRAQPWATDEGIDMYFGVPDEFSIAGRGLVRVCPANSQTIYRVFKQKANPAAPNEDPNHRYVASQEAVNAMVALGYTDEGLVFCGR